jgi:hypothetical protein
MLVMGTQLEDHLDSCGLLVKREDLSCPPPGPPFSKTRGVWAHVQARPEPVIGVLDTFHSQAGHAVSRAGSLLGKRVFNFFPLFKADIKTGTCPADIPPEEVLILDNGVWTRLRSPQVMARRLGAELQPLPAGRSAILFHTARKRLAAIGQALEQPTYMMPNALKLPETVSETAAEVRRTVEGADRRTYDLLRSIPWLVPASSGTIAAGVLAGLRDFWPRTTPPLIVHMGYSRSVPTAREYILESATGSPALPEGLRMEFIEEGYSYSDRARPGDTPPWPCNQYYDLKALRWWMANGRPTWGQAVLWNVG